MIFISDLCLQKAELSIKNSTRRRQSRELVQFLMFNWIHWKKSYPTGSENCVENFSLKHLGVKNNCSKKKKKLRPGTGIFTYIKRTISLSMLSLILYGVYRLYQRQSGNKDVSNSVSIGNQPPTNSFKQATALGFVGSLNTRQGKEL